MKVLNFSFTAGIVWLTLTAHAAPTLRPLDVHNFKTEMTTYREQIVIPSILGKNSVPLSSLNREALSVAKEKLMDSLKVNGSEKAGLEAFLEKKTTTNFESALNLATQMKFGRLLVGNADLGSQQLGQSLIKSGSAQLKTMASLTLKGARPIKKSMSPDEMSKADLAAEKYVEMSESLLQMEPGKRDAWSEVFLTRAELIGQGRHNGAEALLTATMQTRKVDRDTAMEIIRRMAGCR